MKQTDKTLLEQMRITDFEVEHRMSLFSLTKDEILALKKARPAIEVRLNLLVDQFYELQTSIPEISLLIGDADTLNRLKNAQRKYVIDVFSGLYDLEYVNNRLRIGLVHKRIGVEPKLYLSAIYSLKYLLKDVLTECIQDESELAITIMGLEKLLFFDITLVFDTYIRSLLTEIEISKEKSDQYARELEDKVKERTKQLEGLSRTDPLTGLLNVRYLMDILIPILRAAERRSEPVSVVYIDINDLKIINDTYGHQRGDEILRTFADIIKAVSREEDSCFRYGGDEFCVILPNCKESSARDIYITRLKAEVKKLLKDLSISVGVTQTGPNNYLPPESLIRDADERMYTEKKMAKSNHSQS